MDNKMSANRGGSELDSDQESKPKPSKNDDEEQKNNPLTGSGSNGAATNSASNVSGPSNATLAEATSHIKMPSSPPVNRPSFKFFRSPAEKKMEKEVKEWSKVADMIGEPLDVVCNMSQQERNELMLLLPNEKKKLAPPVIIPREMKELEPPVDPIVKPVVMNNPASSAVGSSFAPIKMEESASAAAGPFFTPRKMNNSPLPEVSPSFSAAPACSSDDQDPMRYVKALNLQVVEWTKKQVEENPLVILTPVFKDYEQHLRSITENQLHGTRITPNANQTTSSLGTTSPQSNSSLGTSGTQLQPGGPLSLNQQQNGGVGGKGGVSPQVMAQWCQYYRSIGKNKEADAIARQAAETATPDAGFQVPDDETSQSNDGAANKNNDETSKTDDGAAKNNDETSKTDDGAAKNNDEASQTDGGAQKIPGGEEEVQEEVQGELRKKRVPTEEKMTLADNTSPGLIPGGEEEVQEEVQVESSWIMPTLAEARRAGGTFCDVCNEGKHKCNEHPLRNLRYIDIEHLSRDDVIKMIQEANKTEPIAEIPAATEEKADAAEPTATAEEEKKADVPDTEAAEAPKDADS